MQSYKTATLDDIHESKKKVVKCYVFWWFFLIFINIEFYESITWWRTSLLVLSLCFHIMTYFACMHGKHLIELAN